MFESQIEQTIIPALRRYRLVFAHVGSLLCPDRLVDELVSAWAALGLDAWHGAASGQLPADGDFYQLAVVSELERLTNNVAGARCQELGQLRQDVTNCLERDTAVLLVSRVPATMFRGCPGSLVVLDAKRVFVDRLAEDVVRTSFPALDGSQRAIAGGLPRLLVELEAISNGQLPQDLLERLLGGAITELGKSVAAWIEQQVCKNDRWVVPVADLDQGLADAARGAGLATSDDEWSTLRLFDQVDRDLARSAVLRACRDETVPDAGISRAFSSVWEVERVMRLFVQCRLEESGRKIDDILQGESARRPIRRAQADGYGAIFGVGNLPNVLDWLTLEELGQVLEKLTVPSSSGFGLQFWRRLVSELGPVRNKLAHMRLITEEDLRLAEGWRSRVRRLELDDRGRVFGIPQARNESHDRSPA